MDSTHQMSCIDLPLPKEVVEEAIDKAKDWVLMHGGSMRPKENFNNDFVQLVPFVLLPTCFPKEEFENAKEIQIILNELTHKVAHDYKFLKENLASTIEADDFTAKLFNIYELVHEEGFTQNISLGLLRSDYILHGVADSKIKQVELNTIASSFAGMATMITQYHRYILAELGHLDKLKNIPENQPLTGLCTGLVDAWELYGHDEAAILIVVEDVTYNICDQRFHEFEIRRLKPQIKVIRRSLTELAHQAQLGPDKELIVGNVPIAVVYFRFGYSPDAYPTEHEWAVRLLIERSRAIKCPSIQYHLAGTKKIQQVLAQAGALDKFLDELDVKEKIEGIFTGLYSLDFTDEGERAVARAIANPENFVLKPQREGGGNNIYDKNIRTELEVVRNSKERNAWILMDRICPPSQKNYLIRADSSDSSQVKTLISELGIYGVVIGNQKKIIVNRQVGHVLRTKSSSANEGGIVAGIGALDSPYLVN